MCVHFLMSEKLSKVMCDCVYQNFVLFRFNEKQCHSIQTRVVKGISRFQSYPFKQLRVSKITTTFRIKKKIKGDVVFCCVFLCSLQFIAVF